MRDLAQSPEHRRRFEHLLYLAAQRGDADLVEERLGWGVDPNCVFKKARTPLIANARSASISAATVRILLRHGADAAYTDELGMTALDYARRKLIRSMSKCDQSADKSPLLDENNQLALGPEEQAMLDKMRSDDREMARIYWRERLRSARRVFNDPQQIEDVVAVLEAAMDA
jgi:ankyrin repeat protein